MGHFVHESSDLAQFHMITSVTRWLGVVDDFGDGDPGGSAERDQSKVHDGSGGRRSRYRRGKKEAQV